MTKAELKKDRQDAKKEPKQGRSKKTVDAIVAAATQIVREMGVDGLSTNRVAQRAGVSIGSLYQYFPNKDSIMIALTIANHERIQARLFDVLTEVQALPLEPALNRVLIEIGSWRRNDPALLSAIDNYVPTVAQEWEVVAVLDSSATSVVERFLRARSSEVDINDFAAAAFLLVHTIQSLSQRLNTLMQRDPDKLQAVLPELHTMIRRYIRPRALA